MAIKEAFSRLLNPTAGDDDDYIDDQLGDEGYDDSQYDDNLNMVNNQNQGRGQQQMYNQGYNQQYNQQYHEPHDSSVTLSPNTEIKVVRPVRYEEVQQIADHLLANRTVVLNLEGTNKENARRMIDFLSGIAYSIGGNLRKVSNNTFVITPNNVNVTNDTTAAQPQVNPDPYNQSTM
ncbi:MAG TPA: cell division protein SepF [Clostridiales bacterium]|jgi:cell division inhibitor SepF|nr:cell division protein SepF [Clostridiales bacterium]